jgi:hypothetical protein
MQRQSVINSQLLTDSLCNKGAERMASWERPRHPALCRRTRAGTSSPAVLAGSRRDRLAGKSWAAPSVQGWADLCARRPSRATGGIGGEVSTCHSKKDQGGHDGEDGEQWDRSAGSPVGASATREWGRVRRTLLSRRFLQLWKARRVGFTKIEDMSRQLTKWKQHGCIVAGLESLRYFSPLRHWHR